MKVLYHATKDQQTAWEIEDGGFQGGRVWDMENVVFLATERLEGFAQGILADDSWVAVEVPDEILPKGRYEDEVNDNEMYGCRCYAFDADLLNAYPRYSVDANGERIE